MNKKYGQSLVFINISLALIFFIAIFVNGIKPLNHSSEFSGFHKGLNEEKILPYAYFVLNASGESNLRVTNENNVHNTSNQLRKFVWDSNVRLESIFVSYSRCVYSAFFIYRRFSKTDITFPFHYFW